MILAEFDPVRDECHQYLERLIQAGVNVSAATFLGITHAFLPFGTQIPEAVAATDFLCETLKAALQNSEKSSNVVNQRNSIKVSCYAE